ncbi:HalOD1 output domain-containing protein [Halorussus marinus]|uniref:HalOD1 output domain-containing protein n=1 Tax=Halorussus marinus TaxID=2505976 RepID=UPI00106E700D|nr:HalOD1 output domain-containing protein [Halorussus marinus]
MDEIITQAAAKTGRDVEELPPLHETIDADALETIADDVLRLEFEYVGVTIVIQHGTVRLHE